MRVSLVGRRPPAPGALWPGTPQMGPWALWMPIYVVLGCLHLKEDKTFKNCLNLNTRIHLALHSKFLLCSLKVSNHPGANSVVPPHSSHHMAPHLSSCSIGKISAHIITEWLITFTFTRTCASVTAMAPLGPKLATAQMENFALTPGWPPGF